MESENRYLKFGSAADKSVKHVKLGQVVTQEFALHRFQELPQGNAVKDWLEIRIYKNYNKLWDSKSGQKNLLSYRLVDLEERGGLKSFRVEFKPIEIGTFHIEMTFKSPSGRPEILNSIAKIYDASEIGVFLNLTPGGPGETRLVRLIRDNFDTLNKHHQFPIGREIQLKVDASRSGEGQLEISINDGELPNQVRILKNENEPPAPDGKSNLNLLITFTPEEAKPHKIDIKFNSETIPDCPILLSNFTAGSSEIYDDVASVGGANSAVVELDVAELRQKLELVPLGELVRFDLRVNDKSESGRKNFFTVRVREPNFDDSEELFLPVKTELSKRERTDSSDRYIFRAEFKTRSVGSHFIEILPASGCSLRTIEEGDFLKQFQLLSKVYDPSKVQISLVQGIFTSQEDKFRSNFCFKIGQQVQFNVDASEAGEGNLEITITTMAESRTKNVPTRVHPIAAGNENAGPGGGARFMVTFLPLEPNDHLISITFNKQKIQGWTPFVLKTLHFEEESPSLARGRALPMKNGVGSGMSYFYLSGKNLQAAPLGQVTRFFLKERVRRRSQDSTRKVTLEDLVVLIESPSKGGVKGEENRINLKMIEEGDFEESDDELEAERTIAQIEWVPKVTGEHRIAVSVHGNPIFSTAKESAESGDGGGKFIPCKVYDVRVIRVSNIGKSLVGLLGKPFTFIVETQNAGPGNLEVTVNNGQVPTSAQAQGPNTYAISFTPKEPSLHYIELRFNGEDIPGSPFKVDIVDASKIKLVYNSGAIGAPGGGGQQQIEKVAVDKPVRFTIESQNEVLNALLGAGTDSLLNFFDIRISNGVSREKITPKTRRIGAGEGKFEVEFIPTEVGDHVVEVNVRNNYGTASMMAGSSSSNAAEEDGKFIQTQTVSGSPLMLKSYDSNKVKVSFPENFQGEDEQLSPNKLILGIHGKPFYFYIDASRAGAGNLEIIVSVTNLNGTDQRNIPNYVQAEGGAKFRVNFRPNLFHDEENQGQTEESQEIITNHFISVKFNGEPVPYSPFKTHVIDLSRIQLLPTSPQNSTNYTIDEPISFQILDLNSHLMTQFAPESDYLAIFKRVFTVQVGTPTLQPAPLNLAPSDDRRGLVLDFAPFEIGPHNLSIYTALNGTGNHITGSPAAFNVFNIEKIRVVGLRDEGTGSNRVLTRGKPLTFTVDASEAGEGTLELIVTNSKGKSLRAEVVTNQSSSRGVAPRGVYDVTFVPDDEDEGYDEILHYVTITFNDVHVRGSPFECRFEGDSLKFSENYYEILNGGSMANGEVGGGVVDLSEELKIMEIFLDSENDEKKIYINPRGIRVKLLNEFRSEVESLYEVEVEENHEDIVNNTLFLEFQVDVTESVALGSVTNIKFNKLKKNLIMKNLQKLITKESMRNLFLFDVRKVLHEKGKAAIGFEPIPVNLTVERLTSKISTASELNFKFKLNFQVMRNKIYRIDTAYKGFRVSENAINLTVVKPGSGGMKAKAPGKGSKNNFYRELIDAKIIKFGRIPKRKMGAELAFEVNNFSNLDNMDFTLDTNRLVEHVNSINYARTTPAQFSQLKLSTNDVIDVIVNDKATGFGVPLKCFNVTTNSAGKELLLKVEFEVGSAPKKSKSFDILIYFKGKLLHELVDAPEGDLVKTEILSVVILDLSEVDFTVSSFELRANGRAAEEKVRITNGSDRIGLELLTDVAAESELKMRFILSANIPQLEGDQMELVQRANYAELEVLKGMTSSDDLSQDIRRKPLLPMEISGELTRFDLRLSELVDFECLKRTPVFFSRLLLRGGKSKLPYEIPVRISRRSTMPQSGLPPPTSNSNYFYEKIAEDESRILSNRVENVKIKKFPQVEREAEDKSRMIQSCRHASELVQCTGEGLRIGTVGKDIKSFIDTRKAGAGELTAQCHSLSGGEGGGRNAYCELYDHGDGTFTLNVRPQEPGKHLLSIKYSGEHVPGSPYTLRVAGLPDPSKVRVWGPGIEHGVLATFQSRFICDTRGAGAGQLTVRVRGPKGAFRVEMQRENPKDRTILCKFDPTEPGDYRVEIRWAGDHVPGSPFTVMIFDTQSELHHYNTMLQQQTLPPQP